MYICQTTEGICEFGTFVLETVWGLYILVVMLRLLLQWARADFFNSFSQDIYKYTQWLLAPIRERLPTVARIDLACVLVLVVLQFGELWVVTWMLGHRAAVSTLLVLAFAELVQLAIYIFLFSILIQVVMSWINPGSYNPLLGVLYSLNEPLLASVRRLVPPIGGRDLSAIVVMIALLIVANLVVGSLRQLAGVLG